jgi:signal transduction histidine kinase
VRIEDDGRGAKGDAEPNLGLLGMRERVTALGGTLETGPCGNGAGFRVAATIPVEGGA